MLKQFRPDFRPQYVFALDALKAKKTGKPSWYRINVPGRPNGRSGWVRAAALELHPVRKRLIVYRDARRFEFWDGNKLVRAGKVAVGKPGAETPLGLFYVTWKFDPSIDPDWAILGAYAFETSAYSKLTDWPGGGIVGMHGTPWPSLLGQAVSHGCVRVRQRQHRVPAQPRPARNAGQDRSVEARLASPGRRRRRPYEDAATNAYGMTPSLARLRR